MKIGIFIAGLAISAIIIENFTIGFNLIANLLLGISVLLGLISATLENRK